MHKLTPYFPSHYRLGYLALAREYYAETCDRLRELIVSGGGPNAISAYTGSMGELSEICLYNLRQMEDLADGEGRLTREEYNDLYNEVVTPAEVADLADAENQLADFQAKLEVVAAACRSEESYLSFLYGE